MVGDNKPVELGKYVEEGVYKYNDSYNFDAYLTALGVPWYLKALAKIATPTVTIKKLEDKSDR